MLRVNSSTVLITIYQTVRSLNPAGHSINFSGSEISEVPT